MSEQICKGIRLAESNPPKPWIHLASLPCEEAGVPETSTTHVPSMINHLLSVY